MHAAAVPGAGRAVDRSCWPVRRPGRGPLRGAAGGPGRRRAARGVGSAGRGPGLSGRWLGGRIRDGRVAANRVGAAAPAWPVPYSSMIRAVRRTRRCPRSCRPARPAGWPAVPAGPGPAGRVAADRALWAAAGGAVRATLPLRRPPGRCPCCRSPRRNRLLLPGAAVRRRPRRHPRRGRIRLLAVLVRARSRGRSARSQGHRCHRRAASAGPGGLAGAPCPPGAVVRVHVTWVVHAASVSLRGGVRRRGRLTFGPCSGGAPRTALLAHPARRPKPALWRARWRCWRCGEASRAGQGIPPFTVFWQLSRADSSMLHWRHPRRAAFPAALTRHLDLPVAHGS